MDPKVIEAGDKFFGKAGPLEEPLSKTMNRIQTPRRDPSVDFKPALDEFFKNLGAASNGSEVEDLEEKFIEELAQKYEAALHTSEQLATLEIPQRRFLMGNWMREGDLGFVFGERGAGKTFLVDALVTYLVLLC
jgi:hypothetical protein